MSKFDKVLAAGFVLCVLIICVFSTLRTKEETVFGNVAIGGEMQATSSNPAAQIISGVQLIPNLPASGCSSTLGSVIIQGSAASSGFYLVDATTSDPTKRASDMSTTSIIKASYGASPTVGGYPYNLILKYGLIYSSVGAPGTTTITYRSSC